MASAYFEIFQGLIGKHDWSTINSLKKERQS